MAGSSYTYPFIAYDLPLNHPGANIYTSNDYPLKDDLTFDNSSKVRTIQVFLGWQYFHLAMLTKELTPEHSYLKKCPSKELIIQAIPINKIKADTERILWHQATWSSVWWIFIIHIPTIDSVPKRMK